MEILAFSDLHRNKALAREILSQSHGYDAVVGAGDFATFGQGLNDTLDILKKITVPVIIVPGNHENPSDLHEANADHDRLIILHGNCIEINGISFFGLGGEIPRVMKEEWNHYCDERQAAEHLARCPDRAVVITHTPPFETNSDLTAEGAHTGSKAVRQAIERTNPVLVLCGHIHHAWGAADTINKTPVHNLGPSLKRFTLKEAS